MSGISGSGSGRHVASHAKPGAMSHAKGKVKTAAAVTSVLAVSGGVATAFHMHQDGLRNSAEAASQDANTNAAAAAAANALAVRSSTAAANRDLQRPSLSQSSSAAPSTSQTPTSAATSSSTPPAPSSTTSTTTPPAPTSTSKTPIPLPTKTTSTPTPVKTTPTTTSSSSSGSGTNMGYDATPAQAKAMAEQIVPSGQFLCFSDIIERESSWNIFATNPSSGAYGLGQALPGYKMASMGSAWRNSALIQIKWALSYMNGRYGSPCAAWTFWQAHNWY